MANLKTVLSLLPVLQLFEVSSPVLVSVDASPVGLEGVFIQDGQLVAFFSTPQRNGYIVKLKRSY